MTDEAHQTLSPKAINAKGLWTRASRANMRHATLKPGKACSSAGMPNSEQQGRRGESARVTVRRRDGYDPCTSTFPHERFHAHDNTTSSAFTSGESDPIGLQHL